MFTAAGSPIRSVGPDWEVLCIVVRSALVEFLR